MDGLKARLSFDAVAYDYDDEYLTIDTDTHIININNLSRLFGVQYDGNSKLIKFRISNKLSDIQKMQDSIIYINWIDSKGVKGQSIAINKTINNDTCEFAWKVPFDALKNSGVLHFAMSAVMTKKSSSVIDQRWSTQIASVITPDGIYIKSYTPSSEEEDRIAQIYNELSNMINKQSENLQSQVESLNETLVDLTNDNLSDNITWKLGSFTGNYNDTNGIYTNNDNNYLTFDSFIIFPYDIYINWLPNLEAHYNLYVLNNSGIERIENKQNLQHTDYIGSGYEKGYTYIPKNTYFKIEISYDNKIIIDDNSKVNLPKCVLITSSLLGKINENKMDISNLYNSDISDIFAWKIGSFSSKYSNETGNYTNDDKRLLTTYTFYKLPIDIVINISEPNKYSYDLYILDSTGEDEFINNKTISGLSSKLKQTGTNVIKANTYFRIEVSFLDLHEISENEKNELLSSIKIVSELFYKVNDCIRIVKTVGSQNCDFSSLVTAIKYAVSHGNVTLDLANETFDVSNEVDYVNDREGIKLGNGLHLKGKANTEIICNYTGDNGTIQRDFSLFSAMPSDYILENITLKATNIRYCVHDECSGTTTPYEHKYINCNMYHDSSNAQWRTSQCIGGGFGTNATCIVDSCVFESVAQYESKTNDIGGPYLDELRADGFSWHANVRDLNACNKLIATNNFVKGELGTIRYASGNQGYNLISNNSFGKEAIAYGNTGETNKWNNEIRI